MGKIAVPNNGEQISEVFEDSTTFKIYTVINNNIIKETIMPVLSHDADLVAEKLSGNKVTDVIARNIELDSIEKLNRRKINVFIGVRQDKPSQLVKEFIQGTLITNDSLFNE